MSTDLHWMKRSFLGWGWVVKGLWKWSQAACVWSGRKVVASRGRLRERWNGQNDRPGKWSSQKLSKIAFVKVREKGCCSNLDVRYFSCADRWQKWRLRYILWKESVKPRHYLKEFRKWTQSKAMRWYHHSRHHNYLRKNTFRIKIVDFLIAGGCTSL